MIKLYSCIDLDQAKAHVNSDRKQHILISWGGYIVIKWNEKAKYNYGATGLYDCYYMVNKPKNMKNVAYIQPIRDNEE